MRWNLTKRNAAGAAGARQLGGQSRPAAEVAATDAKASRAMADIRSSSDNIGNIIKAMDEIAFQTNILALNAAVEPSRRSG